MWGSPVVNCFMGTCTVTLDLSKHFPWLVLFHFQKHCLLSQLILGADSCFSRSEFPWFSIWGYSTKKFSMIWYSSQLNTWADNRHKYSIRKDFTPMSGGHHLKVPRRIFPSGPLEKTFFGQNSKTHHLVYRLPWVLFWFLIELCKKSSWGIIKYWSLKF